MPPAVSSSLILLALLLAGLPTPATPSAAAPARPQPTAAPAAVPAPAAAAAPANRTLVGQVVGIDAAAGTLVLRETVKSTPLPQSSPSGKSERPAETLTVRIEAGTQLLRGKRPVPLADLRPGDHAVVRYAPPVPGAPAGRALSIRVADVVARSASPAGVAPAAPASLAAAGPGSETN